MPHSTKTATWRIPFVVGIALFMELLDASILNTAIPSIADNLQTEPLLLKLAITSYLLSLALFIPISGWLADRFGTKTVFCFALVFFAFSSLLCGLATNLAFLTISRFLQGIGGSMMGPVGRLITLRSFPKSQIVRISMYTWFPALIAPALGPLIGGAITTYTSWRWIFYINVPISIIAVLIAFYSVQNHRATLRPHLDVWGFIWFSLAIVGFSFGFESFEGEAFTTLQQSLMLSFSFISLLCYIIHTRRCKEPLFDWGIFKIRTVKVSIIGNVLCRLGMGGVFFLLPLLFQLNMGLSPLNSGLLTFPFALGMLFSRIFLPQLLSRYGFKIILTINSSFLGLFIMLFSLITANTSFLIIISLVFLYGCLASTQYASMNLLVYTSLKRDKMSTATSLHSVSMRLGDGFGVASAALLLGLFAQTLGPHAISAYHWTFLCLGVLPLISVFYMLKLKRFDGHHTSRYHR